MNPEGIHIPEHLQRELDKMEEAALSADSGKRRAAQITIDYEVAGSGCGFWYRLERGVIDRFRIIVIDDLVNDTRPQDLVQARPKNTPHGPARKGHGGKLRRW